MSHPLILTDSEFSNTRRKIHKEILLARMKELIPWDHLEAVIGSES
ncbi:MAG: hypothetical protein WBG31_12220 [Marinomonas sp.]